MTPIGYGFAQLAMWVAIVFLHYRVWQLEKRMDRRPR